MGVNSLPKTVTRQRRDRDLNPGPTAPESSTLTTRLPSHPNRKMFCKSGSMCQVTQHHSVVDVEVEEKDVVCRRHAGELLRFYCEPCELLSSY